MSIQYGTPVLCHTLRNHDQSHWWAHSCCSCSFDVCPNCNICMFLALLHITSSTSFSSFILRSQKGFQICQHKSTKKKSISYILHISHLYLSVNWFLWNKELVVPRWPIRLHCLTMFAFQCFAHWKPWMWTEAPWGLRLFYGLVMLPSSNLLLWGHRGNAHDHGWAVQVFMGQRFWT